MKKKTKIGIALIVVLVIGIGISILISTTLFGVSNPFVVANGLFQITFTDTEYVEIQSYPKVILAKPGVSLESYMESQGFTENTEEQLGALRVFEQAEHQQYVVQSVNKYFAKWHWNE